MTTSRPAIRSAGAAGGAPVSAQNLPTLPATALLQLARRGLLEAGATTDPAERYAAAHLSALRAAAAVLARRARPTGPGRRSRPTSAWALLAGIAPELGEWAAYFAEGAAKRAAAEARVSGAVTAREADDLVRDAETFLAVVETTLGPAGSQLLLASGNP